MRPWVVSEIAKDLHGTRGGRHEQITDPRVEYVVGTLDPQNPRDQDHHEQDVSDAPLEETSTDEDDSHSSGVQEISHEVPPSLDPRNRAKSMGLTFTCNSQGDEPLFGIVVTYAMYEPSGQNQDGMETFDRRPRAIHIPAEEITPNLEDSGRYRRGSIFLRPTGTSPDFTLEAVPADQDHESRLSIVARRDHRRTSVWVVSVMLDNRLQAPEEWDPSATSQRTIFQPCIRIALKEGNELCEPHFDSGSNEGQPLTEDQIDEMLYEGRREVARGHLCSAVWSSFDPQQISQEDREGLVIQLPNEQGGNETLEFGEAPPFFWEDGDHPGIAEVSERFSGCDVRTEFLPVVDLPSPDMDPSPEGVPQWGSSLRMTPGVLGTCFDSQSISSQLQPLVDGYSEWIDDVMPEHGPLRDALLPEARDCLRRMREGLSLLESDDDARLAFNIANQSIQSTIRWRGIENDFAWRKFQIAFVLSCLESTANPSSEDRDRLDLLWVATGGGKTEAYLLLIAFVMALRRIQGARNGVQWFGVDVFTRYTLRLLTIQQFRRALGVITAMEQIRAGSIQLPEGVDPRIMGSQPFGIGIWVGMSVTPNSLGEVDMADLEAVRRTLRADARQGPRFQVSRDVSALRHLAAGSSLTSDQSEFAAEPAQVLNCPCCDQPLAIMRSRENTRTWGASPDGSPHRLHLLVNYSEDEETLRAALEGIEGISEFDLTFHHSSYVTLSITTSGEFQFEEQAVEALWSEILSQTSRFGRMELVPARASRPGYFLRSFVNRLGNTKAYDFQINCPDPCCELNNHRWEGRLPAGSIEGRRASNPVVSNPDGLPVEVPDALREEANRPDVARGIPIPAYTVDDQIYSKAPSLVISTVDKFAQMPFNPKIGSLFGNVTNHSEIRGFERGGTHREAQDIDDLEGPDAVYVPTPRLQAPSLIVQDELHLIEGPLGSMTGFYETLVDRLISEGLSRDQGEGVRFIPKYVASTATIRAADDQVSCLFERRLSLFPPKGPRWDDRGLIREVTSTGAHSSGDSSGRLYMGISPIGVSAQSMQRNLYSRLIHCGNVLRGAFEGDPDRRDDRYWTSTAYFNAVRELAGAKSVIEQDSNARLQSLGSSRSANTVVELSGRMQSTELPILLNRLENMRCDDASGVDVLLTTSMFGTGVDVGRLNLMSVIGQPKSTSQYIQATGRVGRQHGAIVTTYLRSSRPRDLDHYERFLSYHLQLYKNVEPVTVRPFSDNVIDRAGGPLMVGWMRLSENATGPWRTSNSAGAIEANHPDLRIAIDMILGRNSHQPILRRIDYDPPHAMRTVLDALQDDWRLLADQANNDPNGELLWRNPFQGSARYVVLGDVSNVSHPQRYRAAYSEHHPTPQSLREVDATTATQERSG